MTAKYSTEPKLRAILAIRGENSIMRMMPTDPAMNDAMAEANKATAARPCLVIACPSRVATVEDGVPGTLIRIAEIDPPYSPP